MPQNSRSGAEANAFGRKTARKVAPAIGATLLSRGSNEAMLNGKHVVIKCARARTSSVGVSYRMLPALHAIVGAFQREDGAFDVVSLDAQIFRERMTETRSTGPSARRVGIVTKSVFDEEGEHIATVKIADESKESQ